MTQLDLPCERARLEGMTVGQLARVYEEIVGEPTRSRHKQYLNLPIGNKGNALTTAVVVVSGMTLPVLAFAATVLWHVGESNWRTTTVMTALVHGSLLMAIHLLTRSRQQQNRSSAVRDPSRQAASNEKKCGLCAMRLPALIAESYRRGAIVTGVDWGYCKECAQVYCPDCVVREEAAGIELRKCPVCQKSLDQLSSDLQLSGSSAGRLHTTSHGRQSAVDLRTSSEQALEQQARTPLGEKHEALARELVMLVRKDESHRIETIGRELFIEGDHKLMVLVFYRVIALGGLTCSPGSYWNGIGKWQE